MGNEDEIIHEMAAKYNWGKLAEKKLPRRQEILLVSRLLEIDPATVLLKMRTVIEKFVNFLYLHLERRTTVQEAKRIPLGEKIKFLNDSGELPELINLQLNTLRLAGDIGAHPNEVDSDQQVRALISPFVEVVRWFVEEKLDMFIGDIRFVSPAKSGTLSTVLPSASVNTQREINDDFASNLLAPHWAMINRPELVKILGGVLLFKLGLFTDWWEAGSAAPYILLRDQDYINHAYTAELKYVRNNLPDWPNQMQAGLVLMEDRQDWFPNPQNVFLWGVKTLEKTHLFSLDELRQQDREHGRCQGTTPIDWKYEGSGATVTNLPLVIRVKQERDGSGWQYTFEVAADFNEPALFSRVLGPYRWPHHVGIFAKSFNLWKLDFKIGFQAFQLTIK